MSNIKQLGYYAKDKENNLFQFRWQPNDTFEIFLNGEWFIAKATDYETLEIGNFTAEQPITKELDLAMIAVIMGDILSHPLYEKQKQGYIVCAETIANWAIEFHNKHKDTNWEDVMEGNMKPVSKSIISITCWDDAVNDYAYYKLENSYN